VSEIRFTSDEIRGWLEDQTQSILTPIHTQAKQLRDEMSMALQSETEVGKMLLDNSAKEIEKRNMRVYNRARALNKLARLFLDRLRKVSGPEQISYDSLNKFAQDTQRMFMVTDIDVRNWFPRISPFFIMDRRKFLTIHEKAKITLASLNEFLTKEYVKTKTLEETFQFIGEVHALEKQLSDIEAQKESVKTERVPIEREIAELEQRIADLQCTGPIDKLKLVDAEIESLSNEIKHSLRHLQKPFIKMQALSLQGGGAGLTPDAGSKLNQYISAPFEALSTEQDGYPMLKQILQRLVRLMNEGKLKLKSDKARKAEHTVDEILKQDSVASLHARCVEMAVRKQQLLNSTKLDEIRHDISVFQEQVEQLKARKASVEAHETVKEHARNEVLDRISSLKKTVEKNVYSSLNKKIQIL
jgi:hypothetical protein